MHLSGLVQGVGFRPLVYQLATAAGLQGAVCNDADGLHIWVNASAQAAAHFLQALLEAAPPRSVVTNSALVKAEPQTFNGFTIVMADTPKAPRLWIPPDFALCDDCRRELHEAGNRREHYPFITCTTCGPRYSIIQHLPFERAFTTMEPFTLCDSCAAEYNNVDNRRFFAQTTSCPSCGVQMTLAMPDGNVITDTAAVLEQLLTTLQAGKILAIKGIGGFLLLTDAGNATAIDRLRNRKKRPAKPLAVMYPSLQMLEQHVSLTALQQTWLTSPVAPIVLLPITAAMQHELATEQLAPGLHKLGVMLPFAPLFEWLLAAYKKPVVATSANLSGSPIIYQNEQAQQHLLQVADVLLYHNRNIVMPQDDSVLSMAAQSQTPVWLRRSRGLAPACSFYTPKHPQPMLATGALMKSSFAIAQDGMTYISQYMGSTESYDAQLMYREGLVHVQQLLHHRPSVIITDKHPAYFSHELAQELAAKHKCTLLLVQHHKAHAAAVLAENNLLHQSEPVLAVVMDGTGLGDDGNSWGGEFFMYHNHCMERVAHWQPFPYLLGDKMAREPRLSLLSALPAGMRHVCKQWFTETEWTLYQKMLQSYKGIQTTAVGRLFDAAACWLLQMPGQQYEGHAAMRLEAMANEYVQANGIPAAFDLTIEDNTLPGSRLLAMLIHAESVGATAPELAARFHASISQSICQMARHLQVKQVACSGGVFQNSLLIDMLHLHAANDLQLYFHQQLSPNDENVSFGQLVYADCNIDDVWASALHQVPD